MSHKWYHTTQTHILQFLFRRVTKVQARKSLGMICVLAGFLALFKWGSRVRDIHQGRKRRQNKSCGMRG